MPLSIIDCCPAPSERETKIEGKIEGKRERGGAGAMENQHKHQHKYPLVAVQSMRQPGMRMRMYVLRLIVGSASVHLH